MPQERALISPRPNEPVLIGIDNGLHAVPQSKLHQNPGHVGLYRCITDHQIGRDLGIRLAAPQPLAQSAGQAQADLLLADRACY
jgi:hypothetical protein